MISPFLEEERVEEGLLVGRFKVVGGLVVGRSMVEVVVAEIVGKEEDSEAIVCQAESRKK